MAGAPTSRRALEITLAHHPITPTSREQLDRAVAELAARKQAWAELPIPARIHLLDEMIADTIAAADRWVDVACDAKRIARDSATSGEEWIGPLLVVRNLRLLRQTLRDIQQHGLPQLPGTPTAGAGGQVVVPVFPTNRYDQLIYERMTGEVWMQPEVTLDTLGSRMALAYQPDKREQGRVALVLGAGNVSAIAPTDLLYKLYAENQVCLLKMNPINDYLGPVFADALRALIERGFLRIVYGGPEEGAYLTLHPAVDTVHLTGSDKTHDTIVFGPGEEGRRRKTERRPVLDKPITSELGSVSPVIVVPGPWSVRDLAYHGRNIASMLTNNGGFNCISARLVVTHRAWNRRGPLLDAIRDTLAATPPFHPYYPGAEERFHAFVAAHPEAERFGPQAEGQVPWTLIPALDADANDEIAFTTEAFTAVLGEVPLDAPHSVPAFIDRAVAFANERLWGSLSATIIVHPASLADREVSAALHRAVAGLRYGSVVINHWMGLAFGLMSSTWGAQPGHDLADIQSGRGVVHNTYLLEDTQKSVVRGPFRTVADPPWFVTHPHRHEALRRLLALEAEPSPAKMPGIWWSLLRDGM